MSSARTRHARTSFKFAEGTVKPPIWRRPTCVRSAYRGRATSTRRRSDEGVKGEGDPGRPHQRHENTDGVARGRNPALDLGADGHRQLRLVSLGGDERPLEDIVS